MSSVTLGSLFSGIGLLDLGLEQAGFHTIWQVEKDKRTGPVLARRFGVPTLDGGGLNSYPG